MGFVNEDNVKALNKLNSTINNAANFYIYYDLNDMVFKDIENKSYDPSRSELYDTDAYGMMYIARDLIELFSSDAIKIAKYILTYYNNSDLV